MHLPDFVEALIARLETAGYSAYAVGGCVRDLCLGKTPQDYDLCTSATPDNVKFVLKDYPMFFSGEKHGTISVIAAGQVVEITTYRTESNYTDNRHPDAVTFVSDVESDLARRDYTINAMAFSPLRGFLDPFDGRHDLKNKILRAVGNPEKRFREDSLRILRGVRFAVRFSLNPDEVTKNAMFRLAPLMDNLARERVFCELCKLLPQITAEELLFFSPIVTQIIPELKPTLNFDQHSLRHAYDLYTHTAKVTECVPPQPVYRWAALLHDIGKPSTMTIDEQGNGHFYSHSRVSAQMADQILLRLKAPTAMREQAVWLISQHMAFLEPERKLLRRRIRQYGLISVRSLLILQKADCTGTGTTSAEDLNVFEEISHILDTLVQENACFQLSDLAISGNDLIRAGFKPGKTMGKCLDYLLGQVVDEVIPNEQEALLNEARSWKACLRNMT